MIGNDELNVKMWGTGELTGCWSPVTAAELLFRTPKSEPNLWINVPEDS
jgi:hypothetical protein